MGTACFFLLPGIRAAVGHSCICISEVCLEDLRKHVIHAEQWMKSANEKAEKKLQETPTPERQKSAVNGGQSAVNGGGSLQFPLWEVARTDTHIHHAKTATDTPPITPCTAISTSSQPTDYAFTVHGAFKKMHTIEMNADGKPWSSWWLPSWQTKWTVHLSCGYLHHSNVLMPSPPWSTDF